MHMERNAALDPWKVRALSKSAVASGGAFPCQCCFLVSAKLDGVDMPTSVLRRAPGSPALLPGVVRRMADAMLAELGLEAAELSVLLTNDREIHALNRQHRDKDRPTDVLAFALEEGEAVMGARNGVRLLGDVVISLDTAARQARGRKRELLPEVRFLLAHGLLHLIGHDHGNPREKREMDAMTRRLVGAVAGVTENGRKNSHAPARSPRVTARVKRAKPSTRPARARARHAK
jgi:probable rRNA maturation factor